MNPATMEIALSLLEADADEQVLAAYRMALDSHAAPMAVLDVNGILKFANQAARKLTGIRRAKDIIGVHISKAGLAWHAGNEVLERLSNGESSTYFQLDDKSYVCTAEYLCDRLGNAMGILEVVRPEGERGTTMGIDDLTGLYERSRFYSEARRLIDHNPNESYTLVYWDVLRFSTVNRVFNPATGDMVLRGIADSIRSLVNSSGVAGRLGDDRFVFCVPSSYLESDWLRNHSEVTLISDTAVYTFKSTYGVYNITDRTVPVETMCERAAMAQSTIGEPDLVAGVCHAVFDDEMYRRSKEDTELTSQLSYALAEGQMVAYFQPIYDLSTGKVASAEALTRWIHPTRGLIPPGRFIPLFEGNGMITGLDRAIWDQAAVFLEERLRAGKPVVPISVNVSRVDFFTTSLVEDLDEIVTRHHLPLGLCRVEVTESAYSDDPSRIIDAVGKLRSLGLTLMLDDFGSGYSSLNTLKDMPLDILKLDMRFLRNFDPNDRSNCIIEHIVGMAHDLGLKVVAEGVETVEHVEFLRRVGCHLAQGFYYARPQPAKDFAALLDSGAAGE
ncbi:MAG: EAL domain-containing protein [Coriobacteriales bacterium]|nr:EAL domain-containing protein [Coriobacteriales bacterium]